MIRLDEKLEFVRGLLDSPAAQLRILQPPASYIKSSNADSELKKIGENLIKHRQVAVLMVAGGLSTRFGSEKLRGLSPVGPVTGRSLFRLQGEKVISLRRQYSPDLRWIVMTSPQVHAATAAAFEQEELSGAAEFVEQPCLPVVDSNRQLVWTGESQTVVAPTGHGALLDSLAESGVLASLKCQGIKHLFFFQYPNVLEQVCDPVMLGYHHKHGKELTMKGFLDDSLLESVGRIGETDAGLRVIEHYYAQEQDTKILRTLPANMNTYALSIDFLHGCILKGIRLPWHAVPFQQAGNAKRGWKAEQFIFDLLLFTNKAGIMLVDRKQEYAAIKSPSGIDSPQEARSALLRTYRQWLHAAYALPAVAEARVEISPLFALDEQELICKVAPGTIYKDGSVFE